MAPRRSSRSVPCREVDGSVVAARGAVDRWELLSRGAEVERGRSPRMKVVYVKIRGHCMVVCGWNGGGRVDAAEADSECGGRSVV